LGATEGSVATIHPASWETPPAVALEESKFDEIEQLILDFADSYGQSLPVIEAAVGVAWMHGIWQVAGGYKMSSWFNVAEVDRASCDLVLDGFFTRLSVAH